MRGSSWRSDPAAKLRGLAKVGLPASAWRAFSAAKIGKAHVDLAARFENLWRAGQAVRDGVHGADVRRHVLALVAVAPRRRLDEFAVLVTQAAREPVDLRLGDHSEACAFADIPRKRRTRAQNSSTSSSAKMLPSESIGTAWRTFANFSDGAAPTLRESEFASASSGTPPRAPGSGGAGRRKRRRRRSARPPGNSACRARRSRRRGARARRAPWRGSGLPEVSLPYARLAQGGAGRKARDGTGRAAAPGRAPFSIPNRGFSEGSGAFSNSAPADPRSFGLRTY